MLQVLEKLKAIIYESQLTQSLANTENSVSVTCYYLPCIIYLNGEHGLSVCMTAKPWTGAKNHIPFQIPLSSRAEHRVWDTASN